MVNVARYCTIIDVRKANWCRSRPGRELMEPIAVPCFTHGKVGSE